MLRLPCIALVMTWGCAPFATAQEIPLSTAPTQAVYEYQLNYQLPWQRWYGGPGLSLGGTMPTKGVFGYSSLNGIPFPPPLGAGVYVNVPAPHGVGMPVPTPFGPGPMLMPGMASPNMPMPFPGGGPPNSFSPAGFQQSTGQQQVRPHRKLIQASAPGARRMSVEQQNLGDAKLREQQWTQAYVNYRNAADLAPERPEAHFRLGVAFTALKQYASAVREFKRSLDLDPTLPQSGEKLSTIFGAEKKIAQAMILSNAAEWTREDLADTDRLFLLGLLLYFDDDPRGSEILEAALRSAGPKDYILAFLNSTNEQPASAGQSRRRTLASPQDQGNSPSVSDDVLPPAPMPFDPATSGPFPDPPPT